MEVTCPGQRATVLVALACTGGIPVPSSAGNDRNEPPPATAFSTPARKAAMASQIQCQLVVRGASGRGIALMVRGEGTWGPGPENRRLSFAILSKTLSVTARPPPVTHPDL